MKMYMLLTIPAFLVGLLSGLYIATENRLDLNKRQIVNETEADQSRLAPISNLAKYGHALPHNNEVFSQEINIDTAINNDFSFISGDSLITSLVKLSPSDFLIKTASLVTPFDENYYSNLENPKEFLSKLSSIAFEDEDNTHQFIDGITFSNQLLNSNNYFSESKDYFSTYEDKIYAYFNIDERSVGTREILVKWLNKTTGKLELFTKKRLDFSQQEQYVWLSKSNNWDEGTYIVKIYSSDESLTLLAESAYNIFNFK